MAPIRERDDDEKDPKDPKAAKAGGKDGDDEKDAKEKVLGDPVADEIALSSAGVIGDKTTVENPGNASKAEGDPEDKEVADDAKVDLSKPKEDTEERVLGDPLPDLPSLNGAEQNRIEVLTGKRLQRPEKDEKDGKAGKDKAGATKRPQPPSGVAAQPTPTGPGAHPQHGQQAR